MLQHIDGAAILLNEEKPVPVQEDQTIIDLFLACTPSWHPSQRTCIFQCLPVNTSASAALKLHFGDEMDAGLACKGRSYFSVLPVVMLRSKMRPSSLWDICASLLLNSSMGAVAFGHAKPSRTFAARLPAPKAFARIGSVQPGPHTLR